MSHQVWVGMDTPLSLPLIPKPTRTAPAPSWFRTCPKYTLSFQDAARWLADTQEEFDSGREGGQQPWSLSLAGRTSTSGNRGGGAPGCWACAWPPALQSEQLCTRACCWSTGCLRASRLAGIHQLDHSCTLVLSSLQWTLSLLIVNMSYKGPHFLCVSPFTPLPPHCCPQSSRAPSSQPRHFPLPTSPCVFWPEAVFSCSWKVDNQGHWPKCCPLGGLSLHGCGVTFKGHPSGPPLSRAVVHGTGTCILSRSFCSCLGLWFHSQRSVFLWAGRYRLWAHW